MNSSTIVQKIWSHCDVLRNPEDELAGVLLERIRGSGSTVRSAAVDRTKARSW